jgi:hypothetical protein
VGAKKPAQGSKVIRAKKQCCRSDPRCKRCPTVLKRLERAGYAERVNRRTWVIVEKPRKRVMREARK